jgi:hypothetical protein
MSDLFSMMMDFEAGELDDEGVIELFQQLVDNGMAWQLQGFYGRTAMALIEEGLINPPQSKK